jgi:hypothetical protein
MSGIGGVRRLRKPWPILPTLIVNWIAFAQALAFSGLVVWVVVASLSAIGVMQAAFRAGFRKTAYGSGLVLTILWAAGSEAFAGPYEGPTTRAALLACGLTVASMILLQSRLPILILAPAVMLFAASLGLGAAGSAAAIVGMWIVAAITTILMLGPYTAQDLAGRARMAIVVRTLLIGGLVGVGATLVASWFMGKPWVSASLVPTQLVAPYTPGEPGAAFSLFDTVVIGLVTLFQAFIPPVGAQPGIPLLWVQIVKWIIWVAVVVTIGWPFARRLWAWASWRVLRAKLSRGDARQRVIGAWTWARLRLAWRDAPLPIWASPDVAIAMAAERDDEHLLMIAQTASRAAYNPRAVVTDEEADQAWNAALEMDILGDEVTVMDYWRWSSQRPAMHGHP